jgi:TatD DNase family protein
MRYFDAHCHLQDERLLPHLDAALARAVQAGVASMMCCGSSEADWPLLPDLARRFPGVRVAFGLHPWYVHERTPAWLDTLAASLQGTPSTVGEIGLDHALDKSTFAAQEEVFLAQIRLAGQLARPVSIHCRRAWGRLMELLDEKGWPAAGFVLHSYSGSAELVQSLVRRGAFFSFSGAITFEQNRRGREAVVAVPADRLLIETDAPDLAPALPVHAFPLRLSKEHPDGEAAVPPEEGSLQASGATGGSTAPRTDLDTKPVNEPAFLVAVAGAVAALRGVSIETVAALTEGNARRLFKE